MLHNGWTYDGHIEWGGRVFQVWHRDVDTGTPQAYRGYIETHQPKHGANPPSEISGHYAGLEAFSRRSGFPLPLLQSVAEETTQREVYSVCR